MEFKAIDGLMESSYSVVFDNHGFTGDFQAYATWQILNGSTVSSQFIVFHMYRNMFTK